MNGHGSDALPATMRAALYRGRRDVRIEEVPRPDPEPGELLIEVQMAGICGTDAHEFVAGPIFFPLATPHRVTGHVGPMIMGHEFAGHVVAVGSDADRGWLGRSIVSGAGYSCGRCDQCQRGRTNLCPDYATVGLQRHGGIAQYCVVPVSACEGVDDAGLAPQVAALAQPAAIAMHALRRGRVTDGERVAIVGAGGIGVFLTAAAAARGAEVTVFDLDAERLDVAAALGAHRARRVTADRPIATEIAAMAPAPELVYEVTGVASVLQSLLDSPLPGIRIVVVGLQDASLPVAFRSLALAEHELIGTNALVRHVDLPAAVDLLKRPGLDWSRVAPVVLPLERLVEDGLEPLAGGTPAAIKLLVDPWR